MVHDYEANVDCYEPAQGVPDADSCMRALQVMPVSTDTRTFSRKEGTASVRLPQEITDRMSALFLYARDKKIV